LANDAWMDTTSQQQDVAVLSRRSYDVSSPYFFLPVNWLFDHPVRDLAEHIRPWLSSKPEQANQWLKEYLYNRPLSATGWRLLTARLLFPLQYIEAIEAQNMERRLSRWPSLKRMERSFPQYQRNMYELLALGGQFTDDVRSHLRWLKRA
ncbi:hypothetical protein G4V62_17420, partial [Bacillaceae bacterium SIJ1]|nr:hypothetical protein [Litoribacterium kuwaitense]